VDTVHRHVVYILHNMSFDSYKQEQEHHFTDTNNMGSNLSRRRGHRYREDHLHITRNDDIDNTSRPSQEYELTEQRSSQVSAPSIGSPSMSNALVPLASPLDDILPPLLSAPSSPRLEPQTQELGVAISSNSTPRTDGGQPTIRLSIIYFIPHRRNRGEDGPSIEDTINNHEGPFTGEMLGRVIFAMTIPLNGSGGGDGGPLGMSSFEDLLDRLMRQHVPQGPPPTSKNVLSRLPSRTADADLLNETCLVCQENFVMDENVLSLPCKHHFHKDCVTPWLEQHCTCPTCRYELPVDDEEYETERKKRMAGRNIEEDFAAPEIVEDVHMEDLSENDEDDEDYVDEEDDMNEDLDDELDDDMILEDIEDESENEESSIAELVHQKLRERRGELFRENNMNIPEVSP